MLLYLNQHTLDEFRRDGDAQSWSSNPISNPIINPVSDPVSDPAINPVSDPVSEPVSDRVSDRVSDPVSDRVGDRVSNPISNPVSNPVSNSAGTSLVRFHFDNKVIQVGGEDARGGGDAGGATTASGGEDAGGAASPAVTSYSSSSLCSELRAALQEGVHVLLVHETRTAHGGIADFGSILSATPADLVGAGLYDEIAYTLCDGEHLQVSLILLLRGITEDRATTSRCENIFRAACTLTQCCSLFAARARWLWVGVPTLRMRSVEPPELLLSSPISEKINV